MSSFKQKNNFEAQKIFNIKVTRFFFACTYFPFNMFCFIIYSIILIPLAYIKGMIDMILYLSSIKNSKIYKFYYMMVWFFFGLLFILYILFRDIYYCYHYIFTEIERKDDEFLRMTKNLTDKDVVNIFRFIHSQRAIESRNDVHSMFLAFLDFEREEEGLETFANARNAAAGSLRQLDSNITKTRPLDIYVYNIQKIAGKELTSHFEALKYLEKLGFNVNPMKILCKDTDSVRQAITQIGDKRNNLTYGIDGAVIKVDDLNFREILGSTAKNPRWQIAYKYPPEQKETQLIDIVCNVGRTGVITPLAILNPVNVAGSKISKTTLHNEDFIKQKEIKIGDTVLIQKAGDVIPEIVKVLKEKRTGKEKDFKMPEICPVCGAPTVREEGEAAYRCTGIECPAKLYRNLVHFVSREAMNIDGLGENIIDELMNKNLISNIADIYSLKQEDIASLKKNGQKFAENLKNAIDISKSNDLYRLITAFGIKHIGTKASKVLAKKFKSLENLSHASLEELSKINDIGPVMAKSIVEYFCTYRNFKRFYT